MQFVCIYFTCHLIFNLYKLLFPFEKNDEKYTDDDLQEVDAFASMSYFFPFLQICFSLTFDFFFFKIMFKIANLNGNFLIFLFIIVFKLFNNNNGSNNK